MMSHKTSVAAVVTVAIVTVTTLLLSGLGVLLNKIAHDRWWGKLKTDQTILADQLAESLPLPVWNFNRAQIEKILEGAMKNESVFGVLVMTAGKRTEIQGRMRNAEWRSISTDREFPTQGLLVEEREIFFSRERIGKVRLVSTPKFVESLLHRTWTLTVIILVPFELILALSLYLLLWRMVLKPLKSVEAYAGAVSSGNAGDVTLHATGFRGEMESLWFSIKKMVTLLDARYAELHEEMNRHRESEERFLTIYNSVNDAILIHDLETGAILGVNQRMCEMFGYTREEVLKIDIGSLSSGEAPYTQGDALEWIGKAARGGPQLFEWHCKDKAGRFFWGEVNMRRAQIGGIDRLLVVIRNITERKRAEEDLRKSEERFFKLFMLAPVGITVSSLADGRLLDVNQEFERMLGFTRREAVGKTTAELGVWLNPRDREDIIQVMRVEGKIKDRDLRVRAKQGNTVIQRFNAEAIEIDGKPCLLAAFVDVTGQKEAEDELRRHRAHLEEMVKARTEELSAANKKLKELDRLKSMFIASMSHELRTPLNSIIGFTGMTLQGMSGELNEEQKDNLTRAYFSAKHLLSLITDVIDISKIEAGRIEIYPEAFTLREVVDDALATLKPQLEEKGLTLEVNVPPETRLYTDRKRLLQCLINLLSNAIKYTESGGITVASRRTDGHVSVSVNDTGIGIAEKDMQRLFEPFERLDTHLRVKAGGTGLGLYLTRKLAVEVLGGDVAVESIEGRGSTFSLSVPEDIGRVQKGSNGRNGGDIV